MSRPVLSPIGTVVWDGINSPKEGRYNLKIAFLPNAPEIANIQQAINEAIQSSTILNGVTPTGDNYPLKDLKSPEKYPELAGQHLQISAGTGYAPKIFDINNQEIPWNAALSQIFPGTKVQIVIQTFDYDTSGNKGISFNLDCIKIIDAAGQKLNVAGGLSTSEMQAVLASGYQGAPATQPAGQPAAIQPPVQTGVPLAQPAGIQPPVQTGAPQVIPHTNFLQGPAANATEPQLTPAATAQGFTYAALKAAGWNDDQMRAQGYIV